MNKKTILNIALPAALLLASGTASAADMSAAPVFYGVQSISSSATAGSATFTRSDFAVSAIGQSEIANMVGSVSMGNSVTTLNAAFTMGASKEGFYGGAGLGLFADSYAGSTATLYDKAGLTAVASGTYQFKDAPVLLNATFTYRLTGKVADTESSFAVGAGYAF